MKLKYPALALSAVLCVSLSACGAVVSPSAPSSSEPVASSVANAAESTAEDDAILPLDTFAVTDPMGSGTYHAGFDAASIEEHDGGWQFTAELYAYDQYDMVDVSSLAAGSVIRTHTGNGDEMEDVTVESLETSDSGTIAVNGGVEEGGMYLMPEDTVYRTLTMDDYPVYYKAGEVTLSLSEDVVLSDASADPQAEAVTVSGDGAVAEAIAADTVGFTCYNTTVTVENGVIIEINRVWVP